MIFPAINLDLLEIFQLATADYARYSHSFPLNPD